MSVLVGVGGPEVNKSEQVFSDGYQISLAEGSLYSEVPCLSTGGQSLGCPCTVRSDASCGMVTNGHMGTPLSASEQTDMTENITFP